MKGQFTEHREGRTGVGVGASSTHLSPFLLGAYTPVLLFPSLLKGNNSIQGGGVVQAVRAGWALKPGMRRLSVPVGAGATAVLAGAGRSPDAS